MPSMSPADTLELTQVTATQLAAILDILIPAGENVLITGMPGGGKTSIAKQSCLRNGIKPQNVHMWHPVVSEETDYKGLPDHDRATNRAVFRPFDNLAALLAATEPTVVLIEDLGQSRPGVQAALMHILLEHEIAGVKLPDCVSFLASTNDRKHMAGVSGVLEPVKSRFVTILELITDYDAWNLWACANGVSPELVAFLGWKPELLAAFKATQDLTNSPTARTWANLARLEALSFPAALEVKVFAGAVGGAAALEYVAFRKMFRSLVNVDAILANPASVTIPTAPDVLHGTVSALSRRADSANFAKVLKYAQRLMDAGKGEFAAFLVRMATGRDESLKYTTAYLNSQTSALGQLVSGRA